MPRINDCQLIRRPGDGPMFDGQVNLDGYLIAPKELFSEAELNRLNEKAKRLYPREVDHVALAKQRSDDEERDRLRGLGVVFRDDMPTED